MGSMFDFCLLLSKFLPITASNQAYLPKSKNKNWAVAFIRPSPDRSLTVFISLLQKYLRLMHLRNPVVCRLVWLLALFTSPLLAQQAEVVQDADLDDPTDTLSEVVSSVLTAKGGGPRNLTEAELRERLSYLNGCLELRANGTVKGYINTYSLMKTEKTKGMLGRRLTYFPLFEQKLKEHGLPSDLKYLSVVESALNPKAVSKVGATGLWQFMPATGSDYGLRNNSVVEERSDPVKSTDAAARYLKALYKKYNDWALALAAYNSGPTRVNAAIKRAHSTNFWVIQRYLPQETRNYVPAFIAATYICNYYQLHGIHPYDPDFDEQLTSYLTVYEGMSFRAISDATGIAYGVIKGLNPSFKRDYVPPTVTGHFVILPQRVMPAFVRYLNSLGTHTYQLENNDSYYTGGDELGDGRYWKNAIAVQAPEHINDLAAKFGCNGEHLKAWNKLSSNYVTAGQSLSLWHPVFVQKHQSGRIQAPVQPQDKLKKPEITSAPDKKPLAVPAELDAALAMRRDDTRPAQYQFHTVQRNESLEDIARQYATTVESLRKMNTLDSVKVGMRLKVRQQ